MFKRVSFIIALIIIQLQLSGCAAPDAVGFLPKITTIEEAESYFGTQHDVIQLNDGTILYKYDNEGQPYYVPSVCHQEVVGQQWIGNDQNNQPMYNPILEEKCTEDYWTKDDCHLFLTTDKNGNVIANKATGNSRKYCDAMLHRKIEN